MTSLRAAEPPPATSWEGRDSESWQRLLGVPAAYLYETTTSTNDVARQLADAGAPMLTIVIADHQTHGRGRGGTSWISAPGASLLCSIVFRTAATAADAPGAAPIRIGVAVAEAIEHVTGIEAAVKWPNDVVIKGHGKVAGILCEGVFGQSHGFIVAGIGINVNHTGSSHASLADIAGRQWSRGDILIALLERLTPLASSLAAPLTDAELVAARARDILFDLEVESDDGLRGRARGINSDGSLNLETAAGMRAIHSASIRLADTRAYPGAR